MVTFINEAVHVEVPSGIDDLDAFRRWAESADFPETGKVWWLQGEVWVDMSKEQVYSHNVVKTKFTIVVGGLADSEGLGQYFSDGLFLSNLQGDIGGEPDGTFVSEQSLNSDSITLIEGARGGYVELQGTPDMVLEVVSDSSVHKDRVVLRQAYWDAGIREYWLVDARREPLQFDIFRHTAKGYVASRKHDGWVKSAVFGRSFRLSQGLDRKGRPRYTLEVQTG